MVTNLEAVGAYVVAHIKNVVRTRGINHRKVEPPAFVARLRLRYSIFPDLQCTREDYSIVGPTAYLILVGARTGVEWRSGVGACLWANDDGHFPSVLQIPKLIDPNKFGRAGWCGQATK